MDPIRTDARPHPVPPHPAADVGGRDPAGAMSDGPLSGAPLSIAPGLVGPGVIDPGHSTQAPALGPGGGGGRAAGVGDVAIPLSRPALPTADRLAPYLARIDAARFYTNFGPLQELLRQRLAAHLGLGPAHLGLAASGTLALTGLLLAAAGRAGPDRPFCACPAFTFPATAAAAQLAGYTPCLADIDPETWALDPAAVAALPQARALGAVLVVAPFGRMVDLQAWAAFSARHGVAVVVDAAACFDTLDPAAVAATRVPVAISLHATKTLSTAEGGLMLCGDADIVTAAVAALNFGFVCARSSVVPGLNGKLSEYHAAVGLADLDGWAAKRAGFLHAARAYAEAAGLAADGGPGRAEIGARLHVNAGAAQPYAHLLTRDDAEATRAEAALSSARIGWRRWYEHGLHRQPAYAGLPRGPLPVTDRLAGRLLGLPFAPDLTPADAARVVAVLRAALVDG